MKFHSEEESLGQEFCGSSEGFPRDSRGVSVVFLLQGNMEMMMMRES